ncbi:triose-phosphate isomerase [Luteirhabdus pelagi]|jgi:triosephosphate isomerase|uniref:triose-phosphate isomerase n=1 Tax=Luteirhabdus pelagi TaxID=2792783 RepID=UPI00193A539F|nr:triose-phosphate isomerase [Luteirhabdus pelagi]
MRKKIVAGNWKMNHDLAETETFFNELKKQMFPEDVEVMIAPAFTNLNHAFTSTREHPIEIVAQNMHQSDKGAFTGEISAAMLKSVGVKTVILGHSERRAEFGETDDLLSEKVNTAIENEMTIIFCVGESLEERKAGTHEQVVSKQLEEGLFHLSDVGFKNIVVAYEPVWAIGTGETASPEQAQEMHASIRSSIAKHYSDGIAKETAILYGGSVKPDNAAEIFGQEDVDGGLIGGASLKVDSFMKIVNAFQK